MKKLLFVFSLELVDGRTEPVLEVLADLKRTVRAREQRVGQILIHLLIHQTFLVISEKAGQTFISTVNWSVKDGLLQHMKGVRW